MELIQYERLEEADMKCFKFIFKRCYAITSNRLTAVFGKAFQEFTDMLQKLSILKL